MKGYVMNVSPGWKHAMKRAIGPGAKVELDELFEQYGVKYELSEGEEFVNWLRAVKLRNEKRWKIVLEDQEVKSNGMVECVPDIEEEIKAKPDNVAPPVPTKMSVEDVVGLSVRQARETLPRVTDLNLLKYALQEANQLANKDSLCKVIRKRIRDLNIAR
jgi:hypothetical protein